MSDLVLTPDHAHVLLDALACLQTRIGQGDAFHLNYEDETKGTTDGYWSLLRESEAALIAVLDNPTTNATVRGNL